MNHVSVRSVLMLFLCLGCLAVRADFVPVPESDQAAMALKIIEAYQGPAPANPSKKLRVIYFTPSDREPASDYEQRLGTIMDDIHDFYRDGMQRLGFGPETFAMELDGSGRLIFHLVKGTEPDARFTVSPGRQGTGSEKGGEMVKVECLHALKHAGIKFDNETVLIFCNLANWDEKARTFRHHSPYYGEYDKNHGLCFAADSVILNLDDITNREPTLHDEEYGNMSLGKFETVFIGGIAHELGHAFGLPHCGERQDEKTLGTSIMGVGNHTYRDERRNDGKGSFLTMASAMRLASNPWFTGSDKGWQIQPQLNECDLSLTTNVTRADFVGRPGALRIEGTVQGTPPIYGVIAYFDSIHDGGYSAPAATSVPDAQGRFAIEISNLAQSGNGEIRVEFCHANGEVSEARLGFAVTAQGAVDLSQWEMRHDLDPVSVAVENGRLNDAQAALAVMEKSEKPNSEKAIARKLVGTLSAKPRPSPSAISSGVTNVMLADTQPQQSSTGWLTPAANRIPSNSEIDSPFLDCGTLFATGLFAHSPSRYVFNLSGKWKRLRGKAGLHTSFQPWASGVAFIIKADGKEIYRSSAIRGAQKAQYDVDVTGVKTLELDVEKASDGNAGNWALWLEPELSR